jgi:hypothetical protein
MRNTALAILALAVLPACAAPRAAPATPDPQDAFFTQLLELCGRAYPGTVAVAAADDTVFRGRELVMHVRECTANEVRIPLHVGENRSRTWILTRTPEGLRLKHDHRHHDGTEEELTQYGGDTRDVGTAQRQEFPADAFTAQLLPVAATNVWTVEVEPGRTFAYALRREGTDRRVRLEFDLTRTVPPPPAPWGH